MGWVVVFVVMSAQFEVQAVQQYGPFETREMCQELATHMSYTPGVRNRDKMIFSDCWAVTKAAEAADEANGIRR